MQRAFLVLSILAMIAPAHAQQRGPRVGAMHLPLALGAVLQHHGEHGCSQSYATSESTAQLALTVDRSGAARLRLDGEWTSLMGPSPGRYIAGDHEFTRTNEHHRMTWTGQASVTADDIVVAFDHVEAAEVRSYGEGGTPPLPAATTSAFTGELRCHRQSVDVLPATQTTGETPTATSLLRCAWTGTPPAPFDHYASDRAPWTIGSGAGVRNVEDEGFWGSLRTNEVRLVP